MTNIIPITEFKSPVDPAVGDIAAYAALEDIALEIEQLHVKASLRIGGRLAKAQEIFRYRRNEGGFTGWIENRLKYSIRTVYRLIEAYQRFGDGESESLPNWQTLRVSALYLLAAGSTPESAVDEIADRIKAGKTPTYSEVRETVTRAKRKYGVAETREISGNDVDAEASAEARKAAVTEEIEPDTPAAVRLQDAWTAATDAERSSILRSAIQALTSVDQLLAILSNDQRAELYDRIVSLQIAQTTPAAPSKNSKKLLACLTGTLQWAIDKDDPAKAVNALKIFRAKLAANKRGSGDICVAWAKR